MRVRAVRPGFRADSAPGNRRWHGARTRSCESASTRWSRGLGDRFRPRHLTGRWLNRVTDVSRIRGTRRSQEDTTGHDDARNQVREDTGGHGRTREDTTYAGFGTVRPRVQIPGPRPTN